MSPYCDGCEHYHSDGDICTPNREELLELVKKFTHTLEYIKTANEIQNDVITKALKELSE